MPHYDFNWQREYIFKELIDLPAGSLLVADYWYDNSPNNKALFGENTKTLTTPASQVFWGDQSYEEMLFTAVQYRWKDETADSPREDLQAQLQQSQMFTVADDNRDFKLQKTELRLGPAPDAADQTGGGLSGMHRQILAGFEQMDADKDGGLSMEEFGAVMQQMQARGGRGRRS
jgi:hypothetical protein